MAVVVLEGTCTLQDKVYIYMYCNIKLWLSEYQSLQCKAREVMKFHQQEFDVHALANYGNDINFHVVLGRIVLENLVLSFQYGCTT